MQSEYCCNCRQPLEEYEAGFCEGCGNKIIDGETNKDIREKRGRPPTFRGKGNYLPGRKFGRVDDATWQEIRDAVNASGLSLVAWALPMMLAKARREKKT